MSGYADTAQVGSHLKNTDANSAEAFADKIKEQGPQVQVVNWIFEQVTGESLIETIIAPMTGDWAKIQADAEGWSNAGNAVEQISVNLSDNVAKLDPHWNGEAADAFVRHIDTAWGAALYAEGAVAKMIGKGFTFLADQSERLCQEALDLLTKLINKLLSAISTSWIPVVGWGRAVKLVWDAYQIYQAIMSIIDAVKTTIESVRTIIEEAKNIKNALEQIPDVRSLSDAMELGQQLTESASNISQAATDVRDSATQARDSAQTGQNAAQDARNQVRPTQPTGQGQP